MTKRDRCGFFDRLYAKPKTLDTSPQNIIRILREYAGFELCDAEHDEYTDANMSCARIHYDRSANLYAIAHALEAQLVPDTLPAILGPDEQEGEP